MVDVFDFFVISDVFVEFAVEKLLDLLVSFAENLLFHLCSYLLLFLVLLLLLHIFVCMLFYLLWVVMGMLLFDLAEHLLPYFLLFYDEVFKVFLEFHMNGLFTV